MKIHQSNNTTKPFLTIVACQHGNEPFGLRVLDALTQNLSRFPNLQLIIANEEALALNVRGIDGDLNQSFPGDPSGNHEEQLAHHLLELIHPSTFVLDIHTSVSHCGRLLPIVTTLNERTRTLINLLDARRLLLVEQPLASRSLIAQVEGGLSLEFEGALADDISIQMIVQLVEDLYSKKQNTPREREVYRVTDVLPTDLPELTTAQDFDYLDAHKCYPVLINRNPTLGSQGLKATGRETMMI